MNTRAFVFWTLTAWLLVCTAQFVAGQVVPPGFKVTTLAKGLEQPKGIVSALHRAGDGPYSHSLYVAVSGGDYIARVDKGGAGATFFASTGAGTFPVGVAFFGGTYGKQLYVGNAFSGGIVKIDPSGTVLPFALAGMSIAGLDYGRGPFGENLYAGEWPSGNIHRVDSAGNATLFASVPGTQTRYLKFSHGNAFGTFLYFTDIVNGDIYRVDASGNASLFATIGSSCLEGLDFSPGGVFGHYLYVGDVCNGNIYQVAPDGSWKVWGSGFGGVADIHFEPGKAGGFTMYIVDGQFLGSVYAISR